MPRLYAPNISLAIFEEQLQIIPTLFLIGSIATYELAKPTLPQLADRTTDYHIISLIKACGTGRGLYIATYMSKDEISLMNFGDPIELEGWLYKVTQSGKIFRKGLVQYGK